MGHTSQCAPPSKGLVPGQTKEGELEPHYRRTRTDERHKEESSLAPVRRRIFDAESGVSVELRCLKFVGFYNQWIKLNDWADEAYYKDQRKYDFAHAVQGKHPQSGEADVGEIGE